MLILSAVLLSAVLAGLGRTEHNAILGDHPSHVMGFSQDKTTHHFQLTYHGGVIDVGADDVKDVASRDEIRCHLRHITRRFADGDFSAPVLVHSTTNVPGTAAMSRMKQELHWKMEETPRGGRILVTADSRAAREAVYQFLRFQIEDHKTGDCEMPH